MMHQSFEKQRGAALLITLIMVSMIVVLVADATSIARIELEASRNADLELKLEFACRGGYQFAEAHLRQDSADSPELDSLLEEWARPLDKSFDASEVTGEGTSFYEESAPSASGEDDGRIPQVRIWIEDEERKWPLALLKVSNEPTQKRRVEGLKQVIDDFREGTRLDVDPGTAQSYAEMIWRYIQRPDDDESGNFGATPRPGTRSGMILKPSDLALIPGLPDHLLYDYYDREGARDEGIIIPGLMHYLTPWTDLQINVNTAPRAVLRGMFRDDPREVSVADDIIAKRDETSGELGQELDRYRELERERSRSSMPNSGGEEEEPAGAVFTAIEDVQQQIPTMTSRLFNETRQLMTVTSKVFSIWVEAKMQGIRKTRRYVVRRNGSRYTLILTEEVHYPVLRPEEEEQETDDFR